MLQKRLKVAGKKGELVYTKLNELGYLEIMAINTGTGLLP